MTAILLKLSVGLALIGLAMGLIERLWPAKPNQKFLRKGFWTDIAYWFMLPIISIPCTPLALASAIHVAAETCGIESVNASLIIGFGPVARQPVWLQTVEIILLMDFLDYWSHRLLHTSWLWPIHAVHHSSDEIDWLAAVRNHPFNDFIQRTIAVMPLVLVGFEPALIAACGVVFAFYGFFVHANIDTDLGPLNRIFVSPRLHRWHHTGPDEGGDRNFAGILSLWDVMFGTFFHPVEKPTHFGTTEKLPGTVLGQLLWPIQELAALKKPAQAAVITK